jgi:hypothetical protein
VFSPFSCKYHSLLLYITINAPLFIIVREVIFFMRSKHITGDFDGFFEWAKTFLTPNCPAKLNHPHNSKPCSEIDTLGKWAGIW